MGNVVDLLDVFLDETLGETLDLLIDDSVALSLFELDHHLDLGEDGAFYLTEETLLGQFIIDLQTPFHQSVLALFHYLLVLSLDQRIHQILYQFY